MLLLELYHDHHKVSLEELYERAILRKKYMANPPEGMNAAEIRKMSDEDLLDMDYFLNEDDLFADEAGVEGFYIF